MRLPSKTTTFWILMAASALSVLLVPASWTGWLRGPFQPLASVQWLASAGARRVDDTVSRATGKRLSAAEAEGLREENRRLQAQVVHQQKALEELWESWLATKVLISEMPDSHVTLVLVPVVSYDADPRRQTLQIALNDRTRPLVREGQWVAAGELQSPSREMLRRQWLIGRISEVQMRLARVQLTTDPKFRAEVRAVRLRDEGSGPFCVETVSEGCLLKGQGTHGMLISQAVGDYFAEGYRLVALPPSRELPQWLILGQITSSRRRADSSKHYDLTVGPWGAAERLTHVVVISTATGQ